MTTKEKIEKLLELGYTYRWLGTICDVHHTTLSNWCKNNTQLNDRLLRRIEQGLTNHLTTLKNILE